MRWRVLCIAVLLSGASVRPLHALDMREVLENAWSKSAEIVALEVRRAEIIARKRAAGRLLVATVAVAPPAIMMVIVGLPELDADILLAPVALNRMVWVVPAATATIFESMTLPHIVRC